MTAGSVRRLLFILNSLLGGVIAVGMAAAAAVAAGLIDRGAIPPHATLLIGLCLGVALVALTLQWVMSGLIDSHFDDLERLRAAVLVAGVDPQMRLPGAHWGGRLDNSDGPSPHRSRPGEVTRLRQAVEAMIARRLAVEAGADRPLTHVLGTLDEAVLVVTGHGVVSLLNGPARQILAGHQIGLGSSVFAALHRDSLLDGMAEARHSGRAIPWSLRDVDGYRYDARIAPLPPSRPDDDPESTGVVIRLHPDTDGLGVACRALPGAADSPPGGVEHDFRFFGAPALPPPAPVLAEDLPLTELPTLVLDCETTGLDVQHDRVVQIGAVRMHGDRIFPMVNLDRLVNPGGPIPLASTRIHGITDDLVAGAPTFAGVWPALSPLLQGAVMVGHNVAFDRTILRGECNRAGLVWPDLPLLDTFLLAALLLPGQTDLNLETIAARLGVDVHGRHTALGDALVTAEVWRRLLPLLDAAGVRTFGDVQAFQNRATALKARQAALGW